MVIKEIGDKYRDYVIEKRRYLHMNPEPSLKEFETSSFVKAELDRLGIEYVPVAGTGIMATIRGKNPGKKVLLRADMDALEVTEKNDVEYKSTKEGLMHACGHDGHTAMLLGAAHILNEVKDELSGEVKLFFQPGEEVGMGAKLMLEDYDIGDVDVAFAIHLWADVESCKISLEPGQRMAAADGFTLKIFGKSGHGSMPHQTVDATVCASALVMNLQHLVSRNTNPLKSLVVTVGELKSGTRMNVISGEAYLTGTIRCFDYDIFEKIPDDFERVIKGTCDTYGATYELDYTRVMPPLVNDEHISEVLRGAAIKLYGEDSIKLFEKTTGGEDFAYITRRVPGALAFVGIRNEDKGACYPHHNERFNMDEDALEVGMNLYAQFAVDFLSESK